MSFLVDKLIKKQINPHLKEIPAKNMNMLLLILEAQKNNKINILYEKFLEEDNFILNTMDEIIRSLKIDYMIDESALLAGIFLEIDTQEIAIAYLIDLLEEYNFQKEIIDIKKIFNIYKQGIPTKETWIDIINNLIKPNNKYNQLLNML